MHDFTSFSNSVASLTPGIFLAVCEAPIWLQDAFGLSVSDINETRLGVLLSSDTAQTKLHKHKQIKTLTNMINIIQASLFDDGIEVRRSDRPNSVEAYVLIRTEPWIVVHKLTANNEILVASMYRVNARHVFKARERQLIFGENLKFENAGGRS